MNSNLETFLANFSSLAYVIALVFIALACRRIRAAGGDKAFGIASTHELTRHVLAQDDRRRG